MVIAEVRDLTFSYQEREVLSGISFTLDEGQVLGVVGPNGCGKTTLIKCLDRILAPEGSVEIRGKELAQYHSDELARTVAYVPQALSIGMAMNVLEVVLMGRRPHVRWSVSDADLVMVTGMLARLGIQHLAFRKLTQVSGGERQKVMIARALVQEPALLLLDEPTSALDVRHQLEVMSLIRSVVREQNIAALMAIHDLNLAARFCDALIVLHHGRVIAAGPPGTLLAPPLIEQVYGVRAVVGTEGGLPFILPVEPVGGDDR
ncbi:MAG: ABC transporter ATP-binding protein [Methanomicrobiaceae archaeon]|nr:ABC transporter ATP-binding protein [Methanomicrobiaceae archaeon]